MGFGQPSDPRKLQALYVDKRKRALHKRDDAKIADVQSIIEKWMARHPLSGNLDWLDVYTKITDNLQSANLTININAARWFSDVNTFGTYGQMYERNLQGGRLAMKDDRLNPADTRMQADDQITFPDSWGRAHKFSQRRAIWKSMCASGSGTSKDGKMVKGTTLQQTAGPEGFNPENPRTFTTTNKDFDAKTKQVFAALNYGRRLNGACVDYGYSHLVLKPGLKVRAMYYPTDTFYLAMHQVGLKGQESFETLGAIIRYRKDEYLDWIFDACYYGKILGVNKKGDDLIEAHLFQEVVINRDVEELVLSRLQPDKDSTKPIPEVEWQKVLVNARAWCRTNNIRLMLMP